MQLSNDNFRYRGYRESQPLVTLAKAGACDLVGQYRQLLQAEGDAAAWTVQLALLLETHVATLQHFRAQTAYVLKSDS